MRFFSSSYFRCAQATALVLSMAGCAQPSSLEQIQARGELKVLTRPGPATYFLGVHGAGGLDYELAAKFAKELGVKLTMIPVEHQTDLFSELKAGRGDLAAAHITATAERRKRVDFSTAYLTAQPVLVYRSSTPAPLNLSEIGADELTVLTRSSYVDALKKSKVDHPTLSWRESNSTLDELLESVSNDELTFTVADDLLVAAAQPMYPSVRIGAPIGDPQPIAWAIAKREGDQSLLNASRRFFSRVVATGQLALISARYRRSDRPADELQHYFFLRHIEERLPRYLGFFEAAADAHQLDWRVLAAVGYQESHWNPKARSPTGVRGLMMLTRDTAARLGVEDRLDAKQSIHGGARYLRDMLDRVPAQIEMPDRLNFALAAYNIGLGHLEDARILTERRGHNPDRWEDVRATLPLLSRAIWHQQTRLGRAPGGQAVEFVQNVGDYLKTLEWRSSDELFNARFAKDQQAAPNSAGAAP